MDILRYSVRYNCGCKYRCKKCNYAILSVIFIRF